jgi:hypothetical protein
LNFLVGGHSIWAAVWHELPDHDGSESETLMFTSRAYGTKNWGRKLGLKTVTKSAFSGVCYRASKIELRRARPVSDALLHYFYAIELSKTTHFKTIHR